MLACIQKIERYTAPYDFEAFCEAPMVIDAVVRNLEIIGEAAHQLPEETTARFDEVSWRQIVGLRNRIVHSYFDIDLHIVWTILERNLPELKQTLVRGLSEARE